MLATEENNRQLLGSEEGGGNACRRGRKGTSLNRSTLASSPVDFVASPSRLFLFDIYHFFRLSPRAAAFSSLRYFIRI